MAAVLAVWALIGCYRGAAMTPGLDFYQFWIVPQVVGTPAARDIYSHETRDRLGQEYALRSQRPGTSPRQQAVANVRGTLETFGTPFMYTVLRLFSWGSYDRDYLLFQTISTLGAVLAVLVFCSAMGISAAGTCLAVALLVTPDFAPMGSDIRIGNVNRLQLAMLGGFVCLERLDLGHRWRGWHVLATGSLAGAVLFKPNLVLAPALLLTGWLVNQRFRRALWGVAGMAGAAAAAVLVSSLYFRDASCWLEWLRAAGWLMGHGIGTRDGNQSLTRLLLELGYGDHGTLLTATLMLVAVLCAWRGRRRIGWRQAWEQEQPDDPERVLREDVLMVSVGLGIALIAAPLAWLHYYVWLIPLILNPFRRMPGGLADHVPRLLVGTAALLALWRPLAPVVRDVVDPPTGAIGPWAFQVCAASLVVYALAMVDLAALRRESAGQSAERLRKAGSSCSSSSA